MFENSLQEIFPLELMRKQQSKQHHEPQEVPGRSSTIVESQTDGSQQTSTVCPAICISFVGRDYIKHVYLLDPECLTQSKILYLSLKLPHMLN